MPTIIGLNGQPILSTEKQKARAELSVAPPEHADRELLSKVAEHGMIVLPIGVLQPPAMQQAFMRAVEHDWLILVDMIYGPFPPVQGDVLQRVFKITAEGRERLKQVTT